MCEEQLKPVVAFDFDGTYIDNDSLPWVLRNVFGLGAFCWGVLVCLPWIVLYKLHLLDGGRAKERLIGHFVRGMEHDEFRRRCAQAAIMGRLLHTRREAEQALLNAVDAGSQVLVVTASSPDWVEPWIGHAGVQVIGTELEEDANGCLTGRFATPNCHGAEKWRRLREAVPDVERCHLTAYGDSRGDRELLDHAQAPYYRSFTVTRDQLPGHERRHTLLFWGVMALLVLYQLLGVFFGMDVADAGFYLTFYDNIFTHPASVEYNFMYYLSGVLGGVLQGLFPAMGMAGMRLVGVAFNTLCAVMLWLALRRHLDVRALTLGCALVVTTFVAPPYTLSYDLCTIVFYVAAITALWRGMRSNNVWSVVLAGVLAGLNVLVRIPNVLGLSMVLLPLIVAFFYRKAWWEAFDWLQAVRLTLLFLCVAMLTVCVVFLLMPLSHQVQFERVLDDLRAIAGDSSGTASHSTGQMVMTQLRFYAKGVWTGLKLALPVCACWWAHGQRRRWLSVPIQLLSVALMVWLTARMHPLEPLWAMCVAGCIAVMITHGKGWLTWLAVLGLGMMLVMPLGSDGAYNNGTIVCWVAAPVAALWWLSRCRVVLPLVLMAVCAVRMVTGGAYFDGGSLLDKRWTVDAPRAAHIYTTRERAEVLNTVLHGIEPHVQPGTTLMAYGSIPTLNYLTHTHPYVGCSWVEQLSAGMLEARLRDGALVELPPVLRQKFNTLGAQWGAPSERYLADYGTQNTYQDNRKLAVLNAWLHEHNYQPVYEDSHFVLLKPQPLPPLPLDTTREAREQRIRLLILSEPSGRPVR
ncbi:MAG: HAD-IB family phosphatase [Muribaculaceae bacterium]|nr:HAD-IB family phosphatase [Muribaculaceae bacterium]